MAETYKNIVWVSQLACCIKRTSGQMRENVEIHNLYVIVLVLLHCSLCVVLVSHS